MQPQRRIAQTLIASVVLIGAASLLSAIAVATGVGRLAPLPTHASVNKARAVASTTNATAISCFDLPVSSAVLAPDSCWRTSDASGLLVGSDPGHPDEGEIVIVQGQAQNVVHLPTSGDLQVTAVNSQSACVMDAASQYRYVDLGSGTVAGSWVASCSVSTQAGAMPTPANTAPSTQSSASPGTPSAVINAAQQPPSVTPSYYEYYSYYSLCDSSPSGRCPLYEQGASTHTPSQNGLVVLDFGSPCYVPTDPSVYGVEMFFQPTCIPDTSLQPLVENWISGYESQNHTSTVNLTLGIGTSNSYNGVDPNYALTNAQMTASGQSWYQNLVGAVSTTGLAAPLTLWGANDMEEASGNEWSTGSATVAWVNGFASVSPASAVCALNQGGFLADYGDDILGGSGSADGWTVQEVYYVAYEGVSCAEPEIYFADMATEWADLSQWAVTNGLPAISFSGVMTEIEAGTLEPNDAWDALEADTGQSPAIPSVTTISWTIQNLPVVSSVSPEQGPIAGGTQVVISGTNLSGAEAVDFGSTAAATFTVNSGGSISATAPAASVGFVDVTVQTAVGTSAPAGADGFIYTTPAAYHPITPSRIEDTRPGSGEPGSGQAPGPGHVLSVQVTGAGGVPVTGVSSVVLNVTVAEPSVGGLVSVFPTGLAVPAASTMDFGVYQTKSNLVEVAVGRDGQVSVFNLLGTTQVLIDVEGWYDTSAPASGAGLYNAVQPYRVADTRPGTGTPYSGDTLGPGQSLTVQVAGIGGVPGSGAEAVVINVTGVDATTYGVLSVYPAGSSQPLSSTVNTGAGEIIPNQDVVELSSAGKITITNSAGSVDVIVDVAGWYTDGGSGGTSGSPFNVLAPTRAVDTRPNTQTPYSGDTLPAGQTLRIRLAGLAGIPTAGANAVVMNTTVANTGANGDLAIWPEDGTKPTASEINWGPGQAAGNLVVMGLGADGGVEVNDGSSGNVDVVLDVGGYFGAAVGGALPVVSSVSPANGPSGGGTQITITGANLTGAESVTVGGSDATSVTVKGPTSVTATTPAGTSGFADVIVTTATGSSGARGSDGFLYEAAGAYHPLAPKRVADTRTDSGLADSGQAPGPGQTLDVQVAGANGVPSSGVAAVVLNVTVTVPTAGSFITVFPTGLAVPSASTMDFQGAQTQANLVEVALGRGGQVSVYNARGWTQVIVDVEGWYDASNTSSGAGLYNSVTPYRVADTRPGTGTPYSGHALGPGQSVTLQIAGVDGVPTSGAEAVNVNVTAVDATADSFLSVYPAGTVQPTSSAVNFVPGQAVPNQAVVELSGSGGITVTNSVGSVDVIVDLAGWYTSGATGATTGSSFHTLVPVRVVDTRSGSGYAYSGDTLGPNGTLPISLAGLDGIPSTNVTGVVMNLTTTNATAVGNLQVWPGGDSRPASSSLNWTPGETTQNLVVVGLGVDDSLVTFNNSPGDVDLIIDLSGWFGAS